jgi:hypothetical protein
LPSQDIEKTSVSDARFASVQPSVLPVVSM